MRNTYTWDDEKGVLVVGQTDSKTLADIERVLGLGKPSTIIDNFIQLYLLTTDPAQVAADKWYKQHLLVENSDPDETRFTRVFEDESGKEQTETLPNTYDQALLSRTEMELAHKWLKGLRGLDAPERPIHDVTVEQWKIENATLFNRYNKNQGAEISGHQISLNESNQNGIAAVLTGLNLAAAVGAEFTAFNFRAETAKGITDIPFNTLADFQNFALQFMGARQAFFS